jgi:alpha-L-rhamnosidase
LSENGYADLAYRLASRDTEPSWGWWVKNGATTLYENWPIDANRDISENHIMFGEISAWFYKGLGGIYPDMAQPGFRHIWLRPGIVVGLDSFAAVHESPYGLIRSEWMHLNGQLVYSATIPAGSSATLRLVGPGEAREQNFELQAGYGASDILMVVSRLNSYCGGVA